MDYIKYALPSDLQLNEIKDILSQGAEAPKSVRYVLKGRNGERDMVLHYISNYKAAIEILGDASDKNCDTHNLMSLKHYDRNLAPLSGPINLLVGEENSQLVMWEILQAALNISESKVRTEMEETEAIARQASLKVIKNLKAKKRREFNLIREYAYIVPYLCAESIVGMKAVKRTSWGLRLFTFARNRRSKVGFKRLKSNKLRLRKDNISAHTYLLWAHLMFGQIFGNIGLKNKGLTVASSYASKRFTDQVMKAMEQDTFPEFDFGWDKTLVERLKLVKTNFVGQGNKLSLPEYEDHCKCLILEIAASFHILIGMAFSNLMDVLNRYNVDLQSFSHALQKENGHFLIDKALSLNSSTALLYRTARSSLSKYQVHEGDIVCILVADSMTHLNGDVIRDKIQAKEVGFNHTMAEELLAIPTEQERMSYLNFGPHESCPYASRSERKDTDVAHPCFGQFWARAILKQMFITLIDPEHGWPCLRVAGGAKAKMGTFLQVPDSLVVKVK